MTAPARDPLLRRIVEQLKADDRVGAAWLAGSIGRGEDDAWSDLDLHVAVYGEHLTACWEGRHALYERIGRPVLIQQEKPSNAQARGHFQLVVFDGPLEVDWNVGPLSLARRTPWHVLLLAREACRSWRRRSCGPRSGGRSARNLLALDPWHTCGVSRSESAWSPSGRHR